MDKFVIGEPIAGVAWKTVYNAKSKEFHNLAKAEGFNVLDVEDCSHPRRLAKVVDRPEYMFVVAKVARHDAKAGRLTFENIDIFINKKILVTVLENSSTMPDRIIRRFLDATERPVPLTIVYAILDEIMDEYLLMLDTVGESVNTLESNVIKNPTASTLQRIFSTKRSLIDFRRNAGSMREVVNALLRQHSIASNPELLNYFRDLYSHTVQVIEFIETYRDLLSGALDIHLSAVANRTNEVMKVLTIYGTIALPFIVITGFYGMNIALPFQSSPHVLWIVGVIMFAFTAAVLLYFRRKEWF